MLKKFREFSVTILAAVFVLSGVILAGTIAQPTNTPAVTFYTLDDIYGKLTDAGYSSSPTHVLSPLVSTDITTMHSLGDIYGVIPAHQSLSNTTTTIAAGIYGTTTLTSVEPNLAAGNIASGTEMFGVSGTFDCSP